MTHAGDLAVSMEPFIVPQQMNALVPCIVDSLIRVGARNDGGYVIPDSLIEDTEILVSLGISNDWSFDEHFQALNPKIQIQAYDHTVSKSSLRIHAARGFAKVILGKSTFAEFLGRTALAKRYDKFFTGGVKHFPERISHRRDRPYDATLDDVFARAHSGRIFLKVDIEGSEYKIIQDIVRHANRVIGMAIEFHDTHRLRTPFMTAIGQLKEDFDIVHLHANNYAPLAPDGVPEVLEITFVRRAMLRNSGRRDSLPIPIVDAPNDPARPDYRLRFSL